MDKFNNVIGAEKTRLIRMNLTRPGTLAFLIVALLAMPTAAAADCDVTDTGIPEDAVASIDPGGLRQTLAKSGVGMGGVYYGEFFANSGGVHQGGEYDGGLKLYLNADMHKLGLWKGLCFYVDGFQLHGVSISAANIGSLIPVSGIETSDRTNSRRRSNCFSSSSLEGNASSAFERLS